MSNGKFFDLAAAIAEKRKADERRRLNAPLVLTGFKDVTGAEKFGLGPHGAMERLNEILSSLPNSPNARAVAAKVVLDELANRNRDLGGDDQFWLMLVIWASMMGLPVTSGDQK